jgi:hypothetical protein
MQIKRSKDRSSSPGLDGQEGKVVGKTGDYESIRKPGRNAVAESGAERDSTVEESKGRVLYSSVVFAVCGCCK